MTNLTPEKINRVLAEFAGTRCHQFCKGAPHVDGHVKSNRMASIVICANCDAYRWGYDDLWRQEQHEDFLDYASSLDALHILESRLTDEQFRNYRDALCRVLDCAWYQSQVLLKANALQKATALVRALGLGGKAQ